MSLSMKRKIALGAVTAAIALLGALAPASAKGGHHRHHFRFHAPVFVAPVYAGCDAYYAKWKRTGSRFWKAKYFACMG
jgi:hypothetical protein